MKAEELVKKIEETFGEDSLFDFMEGYVETEEFLKDNDIVFIGDFNEDISDSYGWSDMILKRVYKHTPTGNHFMVTGTDASYAGTEWNEIKDVKPIGKKIKYYE